MRIGKFVVATSTDLQTIYSTAIEILDRVGMTVTHRTVRDRLAAYGARVSHAEQKATFPAAVVEKAAQAVRRNAPFEASAETRLDTFQVSLGDGCFFLHDHERKTRRKASLEDYLTCVRFADALPEVQGFAPPVEIGGMPVNVMAVEMLGRAMLNSGKPTGVEHNIPEQIKYVAELHRVAAEYRGGSAVSGNAQGVTSPLTFGDRAADLYLEGGKYGFGSGVYTMAIAGINAPATVEGCAVQAAAEILGAWACLMATDEDRRVGTLILTGTADMRNGKACWSSPGAIRQNCLVTNMLQDVLGVRGGGGWTWYTDAVVPGYQCALDRMRKIMAQGPQYGECGFHLGDLDGASVFSLEQAVIDLDICRGLWELYRPARFDTDRMAVTEIETVGSGHGKTHLDTEYTLTHFREALWMPEVIPYMYWREGLTGAAEADVVDAAAGRWQVIVADHEPYCPPAGMARDVEAVLERARTELP